MAKRKKKRKGKKIRRESPHLLNKYDEKNKKRSIELAQSNAVVTVNGTANIYDIGLLDRVRTQWQLGDWESLARLDSRKIVDHPDRAKLALLAAAGKQQCDDIEGSREYIELATQWGCSKKLVAQVLIAGAYNTLARIAIISGSNREAIAHGQTAIGLVTPTADLGLLGEARAVREGATLGLLPQVAGIVKDQIHQTKSPRYNQTNRIRILETEIELLNHELSLAQQRHQIYTSRINQGESTASKISSNDLQGLYGKSASQIGQDIWVLQKTNFKREGFFVEFGATNGVLLSNTWLLEKEFDWRGICAEPNPKFFDELRRNRSCIVSKAYIGSETGEEVQFVLAGVYGTKAEYVGDDEHTDKRAAYQAIDEVISIDSISLNDFLEIHGAPRTIDYMSIDTEGSEYEILKDFPFDKWKIKYLTIEHNYTQQRERIRERLGSYGYSVTPNQWEDWFELND